jgi:hypothetical protein
VYHGYGTKGRRVLPVTGVAVELGSAPNTDPSHCFLSFEVIASHGNRPWQRLHADQRSEPASNHLHVEGERFPAVVIVAE